MTPAQPGDESSTAATRPSVPAVFVSDLHLFSPRSVADRDPQGLADEFADRELLVLGGDIFDFRWSRLGSLERTLHESRFWIESMIAAWSGKIVYLPGNHDCDPRFLEILSELESATPSFCWRPDSVRLGDTLCLHGDLLDAGGGQQLTSYRRKFQHTSPQTAFAHRTYDIAVAMRVHRHVPQLRHRFGKVCQRLFGLLQESEADAGEIRRVIFGHTHVPLQGEEVGHMRFYNPGAALRHLTFQPVKFDA